MNILSIDIGGTTTKIGLVNIEKKNIIKKFPSVNSLKGHSLKWLFDFIKENVKENYDAISICVPGIYLKKENKIVSSGNLDYKNFYIKKECKKYTNKNVFITNDANAAALGEFWKSKLSFDNVLFYTIGTGIGGAIIIDKKIYEGSMGFAGEFGHGHFLNSKIKCNCGNEDCIEPISSATGITKNLIKKAKEKPNSQLGRIYQKEKKDFSIKSILSLINKNDKYVIESLTESLNPLVNNISVMIYAFNPDAIIIGGGPSRIGKPLIDLIKSILLKNKNNNLYKNTKIILSKYGNDSALYGCAYNAISSDY